MPEETTLLHDVIYYISIATMILVFAAGCFMKMTDYVMSNLDKKLLDSCLAAELKLTIKKNNMSKEQILRLLDERIKR